MVLLSIGNETANSADFTVAIGSPVKLFMTSDTPPGINIRATVLVQMKASNGEYFTNTNIRHDMNGIFIVAPGTYRVRRVFNDNVRVGVEADGISS